MFQVKIDENFDRFLYLQTVLYVSNISK